MVNFSFHQNHILKNQLFILLKIKNLLFNASNNNLKSSSSLQLVLLTRIAGLSCKYTILFSSSVINRDELFDLFIPIEVKQ
jgi:hypothetical protein